MVLGSVIVGACLLLLGWAKEIVALFVTDKDTAKTCTIGLAIMSIYVLDFAINAGMCVVCSLYHPLEKLVVNFLII